MCFVVATVSHCLSVVLYRLHEKENISPVKNTCIHFHFHLPVVRFRLLYKAQIVGNGKNGNVDIHALLTLPFSCEREIVGEIPRFIKENMKILKTRQADLTIMSEFLILRSVGFFSSLRLV